MWESKQAEEESRTGWKMRGLWQEVYKQVHLMWKDTVFYSEDDTRVFS